MYILSRCLPLLWTHNLGWVGGQWKTRSIASQKKKSTYCHSSCSVMYLFTCSTQPLLGKRLYEVKCFILRHEMLFQVSAMTARLEDPLPLHRKKELSPGDPRRLSSTIAKISPPPTRELVEQHVSRNLWFLKNHKFLDTCCKTNFDCCFFFPFIQFHCWLLICQSDENECVAMYNCLLDFNSVLFIV
jgi:hypothetical protein